ncbi:MAG: hypothetical protein VCB25_12035, partial [Myxococcota bacterium]
MSCPLGKGRIALQAVDEDERSEARNELRGAMIQIAAPQASISSSCDARSRKWHWIGLVLLGLTLISVGCNSNSDSPEAGGGNGAVPAPTAGIAAGGGALEQPDQERRPFSPSGDCKACHPRQFAEWRTSPHAYSGISPTFYSLVAAGQNSFGAGTLVNQNQGVSQAGAVGDFCLPCHAPLGFVGDGRYGGNNAGVANIQPDDSISFVCSPTASTRNVFDACTQDTAESICGNAAACRQFEGRTCSNMPPVTSGVDFPRQSIHCTDDSDCAAGVNGCPPGQDCGPCVINPSTIFYPPRAQEGINCEVCHTALPAHQRSCQLFRGSDATGVLSIEIAERGAREDGRRLRLGPYPLDPSSAPDDGLAGDRLPLIRNAFHESARVDSPLGIPYQDTDFAFGVPNAANTDPHIVRPTALSCNDLPYCGNAGAPGSNRICNGGPNLMLGGLICTSDWDCGGCGPNPVTSLIECGPGSPRALSSCDTSIECNQPTDPSLNLLQIATARGDGTLGPLAARPHLGGVPGSELDRSDANYYRSSMICAGCHDVRPSFGNAILRSCQLQDTHICSTNNDCLDLNVGCPDNNCGPCVVENNAPPNLSDGTAPANGATEIDPRNNGYRRVENLFSEWQISPYNHPELEFCEQNTFRACTADVDCVVDGEDEGPCNIVSPVGLNGVVVTCQDCHMSNFPETPLVTYSVSPPADPLDNPGVSDATSLSPVVLASKNDLYSVGRAALEGSQSDPSDTIPLRRVSSHFMSGVDVPLVKFPGRDVQVVRRQQLIDAGFKIVIEPERNLTNPGMPIGPGDIVRVDIEITNVGVGHRYPAGFSHERQNWVQLFVTDRAALENGTSGDASDDLDPFDLTAPCMLQQTIARSAEDARDPAGAARLLAAGCAYRSGFVLDKAHPETGEMVPDGSLRDEDPEDFFVVTGTRIRGEPGDARIEITPGAPGRALSISNICEEATANAYRASIAAGAGIDMRENSSLPFQARFCDANLSPPIPGEEASFANQALGSGFTSPGFGNPDCMEAGEDLGPCVPEIELSDGNERGRCAHDLSRPFCQSDSECGNAGPCLYRCSQFPELQCCDDTPGSACELFYDQFGAEECFIAAEGGGTCVDGSNSSQACAVDGDCPGSTCGDVAICIGGSRSGLGCDDVGDCPGVGTTCGDVGPCNVENAGIVNFQNQFRQTENGVCVDLGSPRDAEGHPDPIIVDGQPIACLLDLTCTLNGLDNATTGCLVIGQCAEDSVIPPGSRAGDACTNFTYADDCGSTATGDTIACNVELNLELNGRPSESVFIQNHPHNFNSLAPLQPRIFEYEFEMPVEFADRDFVIAARIMNRHFPMRFLRNLIGTQVVDPPLLIEA